MRHLVRPAALVANFFDMLPPAQVATATAIQQAVIAAEPDLAQTVRWGNLMFLYRGSNLMAMALHKGQAHLQVLNGAELMMRFPQLDGVGRGMRILKFRYSQPVDALLIGEVVRASLGLLQAVAR
ncbi:uncharacterized protein YdhG (YjbR/CyaY superfamily) [Sphaerotilus sulfidivorans]|jgi:uncharacterized protein YdhG (YjbR/CyaY superfamily)|uniref:DUF1801 domain-containing protein n=1 Tax=Sphaerotilus sulfidivorans TaxID=639200 RepID=A0A5C1PX03_9BURK|nr:DUF1801 domain-containing protein [Sphaerotilus sulfidivorans]MCK6403009.1 DUF1801 domain-containing protein [Sphaerotilus sulfidivorans]NZD44289.1 DUF1801 domain-containing protein [Sphaerotilus sulfidivorans]QEN00185.1 DUF1801 domain-containing protein [Sphaerotilus sulfidivorans]